VPGGDVVPAARVDLQVRVVQDAVLEILPLREQAVHQARQPDRAVVVAEGDDPVGNRGVARVREGRGPRVV